VSGVRVAAIGILTGWGEGTAALPEDARRAAGDRPVITLAPPPLTGDRFRRATRECRLGVAAVEALLRDGGLARDAIRGSGTALVYITAGAYGASNRAFVDSAGAGNTLHFPYTAPSAVPAEVAIEFGLRGPYVILIGGAVAALDGLWQAARLVARGTCERALVVAVETFDECRDLYARGRWLVGRPLVETAACVLLERGGEAFAYGVARDATPLERLARRRAGETLAGAPLIALALARATREASASLGAEWRRRRAALEWTRAAGHAT
jgi:hypothetical protein